ncbi:RAP domain-containing protein [Haematococcus lacustris]|uniref:RAP domain-containing protein n=1 Tax=Haematococcus lacustris TaxID=44745 RepID=A0A6A0A0T6_HAELA|nr:RAP domain-containing protein [Haematococcus lacustris]
MARPGKGQRERRWERLHLVPTPHGASNPRSGKRWPSPTASVTRMAMAGNGQSNVGGERVSSASMRLDAQGDTAGGKGLALLALRGACGGLAACWKHWGAVPTCKAITGEHLLLTTTHLQPSLAPGMMAQWTMGQQLTPGLHSSATFALFALLYERLRTIAVSFHSDGQQAPCVEKGVGDSDRHCLPGSNGPSRRPATGSVYDTTVTLYHNTGRAHSAAPCTLPPQHPIVATEALTYLDDDLTLTLHGWTYLGGWLLDALILPCGHCCTGFRIGWGLRPDSLQRSPASRPCLLSWLPSTPSRTLVASAHTLRQYDPAPRPKQDLEQLVSAVKELPFLSSRSQVEQTSQLLWCFADWARQLENSRARMTQAQCNAVMALLQHMDGKATAGKAGNPPAPPPLQQFDARQLSMAAWSLGKLKPYLPPAAVTSACTALARHSASSEAMKRGSWREWSTLLHGLATAGMQCSSSPDLTRLCDQAVQLLPDKLALGVVGQDISMTLWAMAKLGYTGSAQPLLQSVTAAISQGQAMRDAKPQAWANLIWATSKLPGCREEARQLLDQFAARAQAVVSGLDARSISNILYAMGMLLWLDKDICKQLAERAAQTQQAVNGQDLANSLYGLARLGYLDSSVRSLAAAVAKADLAAFTIQAITNLLYARSMFFALSIHQAVSSGHSQLASEPQLNSMAAALWRECSRRGKGHVQLAKLEYTQLCAASQWLHACTGGQISLAASPTLHKLVAKATAMEISSIKKVQNAVRQLNCGQLVQALAAAGYGEPQQASLSQVGTFCALLRVGMELGLTRGISVDQTSHTMRDGSMSGVVAHVKLQQVTHFDAGVVVNKAVFYQLASDSERAAFMRDQVRASLPEAEAWRQLLQAEGRHWAGQTGCPHALREYDSPPRPKQDTGEVTIAVMKLPYLDNSKKVEQTSQLLWRSADWSRQPENRIAHMTEFKSISVLKLLQGMAGEPWGGTAGSPPAPLQQFDARQLSMAAWSLGKLKPHLPSAAVTPRPGHSIGCGYQLGGHLRIPAPRTCLLPWLPSIPSRTLSSSAHTLRQYDPPLRRKQDLEELVSAVEELPFLSSSIQVEAPAAATLPAQQQEAVSVTRQQGALPLPAAQAKSAGALPSQRAGQAPGPMPRPVRPRLCLTLRGSRSGAGWQPLVITTSWHLAAGAEGQGVASTGQAECGSDVAAAQPVRVGCVFHWWCKVA